MTTQTILHVNSSGRYHDSITRAISLQLVKQLQQQTGHGVVTRDVAKGLPFIDEAWIGANFTDPDQRSEEQKATLFLSDELVTELQQASHLIIAAPIYNFGVPAVLKAWIDQIARARLTFRYTDNGPLGMLAGKKAFLVMASGGVPIESEIDFATNYLKQVMAFIGIQDVTVVNANELHQAANQSSIQEQLARIATG